MALPNELTFEDDLAALAEVNAGEAGLFDDASAYASWKSALEDHSEVLDRLQISLNNMKSKAAHITAALNKEAEARAFTLSIDELVDSYEETEKKLRRIALPQIEEATRRKREQFALPVPPAERARAIALWDRSIRLFTESLRLIRDLRWQLMALRAAVEDPGDAPVFDDPNELLRYLGQAK